MKNIKVRTVLVAMSFGFCLNASAQKIEDTVLKYEYVQQPSNPLTGLESYSFTVTTQYPENHYALLAQADQDFQDRLAAFPAEVEVAERIHEERLANYDDEVALAQENFKLETEAFDNLSAIEKLALEEGRPKLRMPSKPGIFRAPSEPTYIAPNTSNTIIYNRNVLADTYLKLEGFDKGNTNAITGSIVMDVFEAGEPQRKEITTRVYNSTTKQYENKKTYSYETAIKRPTRLTLTFNGQTIYDDIFEGTGEYTTIITSTLPNLIQIEKDNVASILVKINTYINEQYGFVNIPTTITLRSPKNKGDHDDLEKAGKLAKRGINPMGSSDGKGELAEAIQIWEAALGESNLKDKKARINQKITQTIYQNLIEASIFQEKFIIAQDYLILLDEMDLKNNGKTWVAARTAFIETRLGN